MNRIVRAIAVAVAIGGTAATLAAQTPDTTRQSASPRQSPNYVALLGVGAGTSILLHEAGHIAMSFALGHHPTFGFDQLRPTVYSNIDSHTHPHDQFLFSAAGLTVQSLIDEAILDIPHDRGSAFERGMLAGGIGTTLFYVTIGRMGSVSDVVFMARMHGMTKTQSTLVFGGLAAIHTIRIARDDHYSDFFVRPRVSGGLDLGMSFGR